MDLRGLSPSNAGRRMMRRTLFTLGCAVALLSGCLPDDQRTDSVESSAAVRAALPPELLAQIDSGNAAYRRGDFAAAVESFDAVTAAAPDDPTGWFGLYMAHQSLGNAAAADSAIAIARSLAPGASLIRMPSDSGGG